MAKKTVLIVVESPTKAKALNEYLKAEDDDYNVLSTYGHIRKLQTKNGVDINNFVYSWENTPQWGKHKNELISYAKNASKIIVATDLDREGEGIAWHFIQFLKSNKIDGEIERIVFHSISKKAILEALANPIELRLNLVESYLARIGLDYIFGFNISPILWRKVPCCKSAGRVQSAALRLIVERENEIKNFISEPYIIISAKFKNIPIDGVLVELNQEKFENGNIFNKIIDIKKFDVDDLKGDFKVSDIAIKKNTISPNPAFTTSTLQQAASTQLNFSPSVTMQLAQKLYEGFSINGQHVGLITYMRTDSIKMDDDFVSNVKGFIKGKYGEKYISQKKFAANSKIKHAQEAHEAIRPLNINLLPKDLDIDPKLVKLYQLIWIRTVASLMSDSISESMNIKVLGRNHQNPIYEQSIFEIKTTKTLFDGFKILQENDTQNINLNIAKDQELFVEKFSKTDHETQPPKRYSEASIIHTLEKKGIGRPSTYEKILKVLTEREYTIKEKKALLPTQKGWLVTAFLKYYFPEELAYEFTSQIEEELDNMNIDNTNHINMLKNFCSNLCPKIDNALNTSPLEISRNIQQQFPEYFLADIKKCSLCGSNMMLKITRVGAMLGCCNYPDCKNIANLESQSDNKINDNVAIKSGPYGAYVEVKSEDNDKPKRIPVPQIWKSEELTQEQIDFLSSLPKSIGKYKDEDLVLSIGRFGPYVAYNKTYISIKNPMEIHLESITKKLEQKIQKNNSSIPHQKTSKLEK